jgi:predicted nucleic acid-binding protein
VPVLDASVCVALFNDREPGHDAAMAWLSAASSGPELVVAPVILLPEVAAALARGTAERRAASSTATAAADAIATAIELLRSRRILELFPLDEALAAHAAALAGRLGLRGADALYVALADQLAMPLVSFDRQQLERGGRLVEVHVPRPPAPG